MGIFFCIVYIITPILSFPVFFVAFLMAYFFNQKGVAFKNPIKKAALFKALLEGVDKLTVPTHC
jgi:hypothetical protein